jgi:hypothetical protein
MDSHVHSGSAPRVSHPLGGFSQTRARSLRAHVSVDRYLPLPFRTSSPSRFHPQESRVPSGTAGSLVVRVGDAFECGRSCPDLPGLLPTPAAFRPAITEAPGLLPCVLVCGRPRRGGRSPSRARATFAPFTEVKSSSSPAGTANRAHPRVAPSTSERSSSRVPDALPPARAGLVGRDLRGVLPLQSVLPVPGLRP